jgi:RNA polymerase sigma-70 factor (ECF subfamily)
LASAAEKEQSEGWMDRLLRGEHQAFAEFVDKYKELVFICCRTLGLKGHEAEDAASETFLAVYNGLSRYKGQSSLSTWLWRIAYRQGVNYLRKNKKCRQPLAGPDTPFADSEDTQTSAQAERKKEEAELVWQAVEQLPRLWAITVVLFYREGKSISEIAKIIKIRQNTVKTYLFRARLKLKELLADVLGENTDDNE